MKKNEYLIKAHKLYTFQHFQKAFAIYVRIYGKKLITCRLFLQKNVSKGYDQVSTYQKAILYPFVVCFYKKKIIIFIQRNFKNLIE